MSNKINKLVLSINEDYEEFDDISELVEKTLDSNKIPFESRYVEDVEIENELGDIEYMNQNIFIINKCTTELYKQLDEVFAEYPEIEFTLV